MRAMLDHDHTDRRQLGDLAAAEPATGLTLLDRELMAAPAARIRVVIDDLIDLILGLQNRPAPRCPDWPPALPWAPSRPSNSFAFARASARRC